MSKLTVDELKKIMPNRKNTIDESLVDMINQVNSEPEFQGVSVTDTVVMYEGLLTKHKAGIRELVDAVRFCAYLMSMEDNYTEAYKRVFAYRDFVKDRLSALPGSKEYNELSGAASRYRNMNKLVTDLIAYSQIPLRLMFLGAKYDAVGVLVREMKEAQYSRDRIAAAKEVLLALKEPENVKIELDIGVKETSAVASLQSQLAELASNSIRHLEAGTTDLKRLGAMSVKTEEIIEGEIE